MSEIQKAFQAMQPYLVGVRYVDGTPILDIRFKAEWVLPKSSQISQAKVEGETDQYILFSQTKGIGLDELLVYLEASIKANVEREKKVELLKVKINELKELFNSNSLIKLQQLKYIFHQDEEMPTLDVFTPEPYVAPTPTPEPVVETSQVVQEGVYDPTLTEEEREILAEEKRAENFKKYREVVGDTKKKLVKTAPKASIQTAIAEMEEPTCNCGPDEYCTKCIDSKGL